MCSSDLNYLPSANRGRSNSLTSTLSHEANELLRGTVQYSTSISAPPIYTSDVSNQPGANAPQYQQFWTQQQVPVTNPSAQSNTHAFYNQQQTVVSTTSSPPVQMLEAGGASHVVTAPAYSTAETLATTDQPSTSSYYKDFDFSYFMNPPNA